MGSGFRTEAGECDLLLILELGHAAHAAVIIEGLLLAVQGEVPALEPEPVGTKRRGEPRWGFGLLVREVQSNAGAISLDRAGLEIYVVVNFSQAVLETVSAVREREFTMCGWEASHFIMWAYISSVLLMWMLAMRYCFTSP